MELDLSILEKFGGMGVGIIACILFYRLLDKLIEKLGAISENMVKVSNDVQSSTVIQKDIFTKQQDHSTQLAELTAVLSKKVNNCPSNPSRVACGGLQ